MIVLHGSCLQQRFCVWGESHAQEKRDDSWPYSLNHQQLLASLAKTGLRHATQTTISAIFPAAGDVALPSSRLFGESPPHQHSIRLRDWTIAAVEIPPDTAVEFLKIEEPRIEPGLFYGSDLLFWTQGMRFVHRLLLHQKFLPWLQNGEAHWMPVLVREDQLLFDELARSMPAYCRAYRNAPVVVRASRSPATPPKIQPADKTPGPHVSTAALLHDFVSFFLDHVVRASAHAGVSAATVHDKWLAALQTQSASIQSSEQELQSIQTSLNTWAEPIARMIHFPYRVAFRLEEPRGKKDYWYIRYFLQKQDDPSLLIPAAHIWKAKRSARQVLKQDFERSWQNLLSELAQAGRLDPFVELSLHGPAPEGYRTDSKGAWEFLDAKAWILQESGYGVLLPSWWARKEGGFRLALKAKAKSTTPKAFAGTGENVLIDFDWKFALGDQEITYRELMSLARLKQPLVKFRGRWIALRPEQIVSAVEFWRSKQLQSGSLFDLLKLSIGAEQVGELPIEGVEAEGWLADFLVNFQEHSRYKLIDVPKSFTGKLRPYQRRGYSWLHFMKTYGIGACLADDMGLGKTVQSIVLLLNDFEQTNFGAQANPRVLIICPTSVVGNWQREFARFAPNIQLEVHHGTARKKGDEFLRQLEGKQIVISSYSLLLRDLPTLGAIPWRAVILDEAQNIKNSETKQAKAARVLAADYRIALTGTPVENHVGELWSIMEFLNRGLLGTKTEFTRKYFAPIHAQADTGAMEDLKRITGPFILRRLKSDSSVISDLPKKLEMKVFCNLTKEQASLYAAVVRELEKDLEEAEGIQRKGKILSALTKLKQICNHPAHFLADGSLLQDRSGKLSRITEMLEEIVEVQERSLIFTQFAEMGELLRAHLQNYFGREALFLHGGTPRKRREEMVERFQQSEDAPPFFVLSLKAGGTGLNLTAANHVFHFDRWWNPAVENQATDRAYRIGQKKNVQIHKYICAGTLEERIDQMLEKKKEVAESVIGTGEAWLTELSTNEIKSLIALGKDAVAV